VGGDRAQCLRREYFCEKEVAKGLPMAPRLTSDFWVRAYLARLEQAGIPAFVTAKGDATAGAVLIKVASLDGQARAYQRSFDLIADMRIWVVLSDGDEMDVDAAIARQRKFDPDLWVIEVEDRQSRSLLDQDGLNE
jgi:hypothetical protein